MNRPAPFILTLLTVVCPACTAEQLERFNEGLTASSCALEVMLLERQGRLA
jgi:hypothetical protein